MVQTALMQPRLSKTAMKVKINKNQRLLLLIKKIKIMGEKRKRRTSRIREKTEQDYYNLPVFYPGGVVSNDTTPKGKVYWATRYAGDSDEDLIYRAPEALKAFTVTANRPNYPTMQTLKQDNTYVNIDRLQQERQLQRIVEEIEKARRKVISDSIQAVNLEKDFILKEGIENTMNSSAYDKEKDRWYPEKSYEGGNPTIGKGLKLNNKNTNWYKIYAKQGYLTNQQMEDGVLEMIAKSYSDTKNFYNERYGEGNFEKLTPKWRSVLMDYSYNGVLPQFKNFIHGVYLGDKDIILKEYKRYSNGKELTNRNNEMFNLINKYINENKK